VYRLNTILESLEGLVKQEHVLAAFAEADVEGLNHVVLSFRVIELKYIKGLNIIMYYLPGQDLISWVRLEVLVSSDVPARDFMGRMYSELIAMKAEVVVKRDGISVIKRLGVPEIKTEVWNFLSRVIKIVEGIDINKENLRAKLIYSKHAVL